MKRMPVLFVGHGSPMNIIMDNAFTRTLHDLSWKLPSPKAVCIVSAHWQTKGTFVSCQENLSQIYDFYGFPEELYEVRYEPPGYPDLAVNGNVKVYQLRELKSVPLPVGEGFNRGKRKFENHLLFGRVAWRRHDLGAGNCAP